MFYWIKGFFQFLQLLKKIPLYKINLFITGISINWKYLIFLHLTQSHKLIKHMTPFWKLPSAKSCYVCGKNCLCIKRIHTQIDVCRKHKRSQVIKNIDNSVSKILTYCTWCFWNMFYFYLLCNHSQLHF